MLLSFLNTRSDETELMDNLALSGSELHQTLNGLSTINKYLGNTNATRRAIIEQISRSDKALTIVDLGCGGGDNLRSIANWCFANKKSVQLIGIDGNENILEFARNKNQKDSPIDYLQADILSDAFTLPTCDILTSSHFMYHFSDEALIKFLHQSKSQVNNKIIFSELQRNKFAYLLFKIGGPCLPFSRMVKLDGLKAIRRAFNKSELSNILEQAGLTSYKIDRKWAFRYLTTVDL